MPPEPATSGVKAIVIGLSGVAMSLLGVDYYSLIWAMVGALWALFLNTERMGRVRSVIYVSLSTCIGAAVGTAGVSLLTSESRALLIVLSMVVGFGAHRVMSALLASTLQRIDKLGGQ